MNGVQSIKTHKIVSIIIIYSNFFIDNINNDNTIYIYIYMYIYFGFGGINGVQSIMTSAVCRQTATAATHVIPLVANAKTQIQMIQRHTNGVVSNNNN